MKKLLFFLLILGLSVGAAMAQNDKKSTSIVTIAGEAYYVHTVAPGETFYSLTRLYGVDEPQIRKNNPQTGDGLQAGQVLKIPVISLPVQEMSQRQKNRLFDTHVVNQGETSYSISKRYGISITTLIEDNEGFDPLNLSIGQRINIRTKEQGKISEQELKAEMDNYRDALNSVSDNFRHHVVQQGNTLYSLSKTYNVPIDSIQKYNQSLLTDGLKEGTLLRIPLPGASPAPDEGTRADVGIKTENGKPAGYIGYIPDRRENIPVKTINIQAPIRVAMLLPLTVDGKPNRQFLEFYQGALIALDELKALGISSQLDLFDTGRSAQTVESILQKPELQQTDLIIGPVYEENIALVSDFARERGIPMVSPLAQLERENSSLLYQAAPSTATKNDKLRAELAGDKNVIVFSTSQNDTEFENEIEAILPPSARRINYSKAMSVNQIQELLSADQENILIVLSRQENATEEILARISSVQNSMVSRSIRNPVIKVVGNARWPRFQNIDKDLFFKLNVMYTASYHADRGNQRILNFDRKYVAAFNSLPSLYAYRGYDVTKLFVGNLKLHGSRFGDFINDGEIVLLQTPYHFRQNGPGQRFVNDSWALVTYRSDYTTEVR